MSVKDKIALVTGGSGGIGSVIAKALAKEGAKVILFGGNNLEKLDRTAKEICAIGGFCAVESGDLTLDSVLDSAFNNVIEKFGGVDIIINSAGLAHNTLVEQTPIELYDKIMKINVRTPYLLIQKALPYLKKSNYATIVNIASVVAHQGYPLQSAYSASKHALLGFTKSLAQEVYNDGIRVHAVSPGGVYTDMIKVSRPDLTGEGMIMPEDVADAVMFLINNRTNAVIDEIIMHRVNKTPFLV